MGLGPWYSFSSLTKSPADDGDVSQSSVAPAWPPAMDGSAAVSTETPLVDEVMQEVESAISAVPTETGLSLGQVAQLRSALEQIQVATARALDVLSGFGGGQSSGIAEATQQAFSAVASTLRQIEGEMEEGARVVEGVFDGQNMQGADGKQYTVPPNYASKSKLVEGDLMKLTITGQGSFIYKQIRPIERARIIAKLDQHPETREFIAILDDRRWRILTASVTYFKGNPGDEVVLIVPQSGISRWAAVENIIRVL